MAKLTDKFFNRIIEGKLELSEEELNEIKNKVKEVEILLGGVIPLSAKVGDIFLEDDGTGIYYILYVADNYLIDLYIPLEYSEEFNYVNYEIRDLDDSGWVYYEQFQKFYKRPKYFYKGTITLSNPAVTYSLRVAFESEYLSDSTASNVISLLNIMRPCGVEDVGHQTNFIGNVISFKSLNNTVYIDVYTSEGFDQFTLVQVDTFDLYVYDEFNVEVDHLEM